MLTWTRNHGNRVNSNTPTAWNCCNAALADVTHFQDCHYKEALKLQIISYYIINKNWSSLADPHYLLDCLLGRNKWPAHYHLSLPSMVNWQVLAVNPMAPFHKSIGRFVVHRSQRPNMADQLIQQSGFNQISLLRDQWLFWQDHLFGSHWVSGKKAPIDVATVPQVWVVRILRQSNASSHSSNGH